MAISRAATSMMLLMCGLVAACGGFRAPSLGGPQNAVVSPANPQMGQVVNGAYVVAPGDTLATISARTNTPIRALIDNNGLQPPYNLRAGQELRISERQTYQVQAGDTVIGIARRFNVSQSALVDLNDLQPPFTIHVGQSLTLPSSVEAPQQTAAAQQPIVAAPAGEISAEPLPSQGGVAATPITNDASANNAGAKPFSPEPVVSSPTTLTPAASTATPVQAPAAPGEPDLSAAEEAAERAYEDAQKQKQQQAAAAVPVPAVSVPSPVTTVPTAPAAPAAVPAAPVETASVAPVVGPPSAAGFSWPVQGKVIAKFGATADGLRNDGINIAAPAGAPVMAAADGTVAYAGNQLRGFGNLVLVRHDNGLITAYAHNQSLLVEKGAKVKRGDTIARVGSTGSVDKPQLHFEIRKGEQAVDPLKYLDG